MYDSDSGGHVGLSARARPPAFLLVITVALSGCGGAAVAVGETTETPVLGQNPSEEGEAPADQVQRRVEAYLAARSSEDSEDTAEFLLPSGLEVFERLRSVALTASPEETRALAPADRLAVLYLRQLFPRAELTNMSLSTLAASLAEQRPASAEAPVGTSVRRVEVDEDRATAFYEQGETELAVHCKQQGGVWLIDLSSTWDASAEAFNEEFLAAVERTGGDADALTEDLLGATTGVAFNEALWSPPAPVPVPVPVPAPVSAPAP